MDYLSPFQSSVGWSLIFSVWRCWAAGFFGACSIGWFLFCWVFFPLPGWDDSTPINQISSSITDLIEADTEGFIMPNKFCKTVYSINGVIGCVVTEQQKGMNLDKTSINLDKTGINLDKIGVNLDKSNQTIESLEGIKVQSRQCSRLSQCITMKIKYCGASKQSRFDPCPLTHPLCHTCAHFLSSFSTLQISHPTLKSSTMTQTITMMITMHKNNIIQVINATVVFLFQLNL